MIGHAFRTVPLPNWVSMLKAMALWLALVGPFLYRKWDAYRWAKWKYARQEELHEIEHLVELFEFMSKTTGRRLPHLLEKAEAIRKKREEEINKMLKKLED